MAGGIGQYLQETRAELRHVAWPTRTQTIVYTILVASISVGISLYLGLFDFIFTTGLARVVGSLPTATPPIVQPISTSSLIISTSTPAQSNPSKPAGSFTIPGQQ